MMYNNKLTDKQSYILGGIDACVKHTLELILLISGGATLVGNSNAGVITAVSAIALYSITHFHIIGGIAAGMNLFGKSPDAGSLYPSMLTAYPEMSTPDATAKFVQWFVDEGHNVFDEWLKDQSELSYGEERVPESET